MWIALTRSVPPSIERCELTHLQRERIVHATAVREHAAYEDALRRAGCHVVRLPDLPEQPDSVFVEDAAVVFDEIAVITRPGAESRRGEVPSVAAALAPYRRLASISPPATLDGGDVLVAGRTVYVGISGRTNAAGAGQLATILAPHGYRVVPVSVTGCLHLKSAVTMIPAASCLVINPALVERATFEGFDIIEIDPAEPMAANVLAVGEQVVCAEAHAQTRRRLHEHGIATVSVPAGELAKAEGAVTCCSILISTVD